MARTNPSPGSRFWIGQAKLVAREAQQVVNQLMLTMGLEQSQRMATVFGGITRHNPEDLCFRRFAQENGFKAAVQWRDSGQPIPEGDEARALTRDIEARRPSRAVTRKNAKPATESTVHPVTTLTVAAGM